MKSKEKLGILYICTGPYIYFWKLFYDTFNQYFMPDVEKEYYVFTDIDSIYNEHTTNVHKFFLENKPWPLVTLLRFHTFLSIEDELKKNDYLMFCNANLACNRMVSKSEIMPRKNENYFFTLHPGFFQKRPWEFCYERRSVSTAYIPYNCGKAYVIGAIFGGRTEAFLEMARILESNINTDLKKNIIAEWHDESHINHYILNRKDIRFLSPSYCYPCGFEGDYEKIIYAVDKKSVFDIETFKGSLINIPKKGGKFNLLWYNIGIRLKPFIIYACYIRDVILRKQKKKQD